VVDLGSVSTSLLLTDGRERIRRSVDTNLGAGALTASGEPRPSSIGAEALTDLQAALADFRRLADDVGAEVRVVATAAARRASNRTALETIVADSFGEPLDVLDSHDEAALAFAGACTGIAAAEPTQRAIVTIDLGGGSTDFAVGDVGGSATVWSMPIGGVLVTDAFLAGDPPRPEELSAALSVVGLHVDDLRREAPAIVEALTESGEESGPTVLGLGGVATVAAVEIGLLEVDPLNGDGDGPVHGLRLSHDAVEDVFRTLATESRADRAHNPGLPPSRVENIVGGCVVLVETMRQLAIDTITVSQRGLADGALTRPDLELSQQSDVSPVAENR
jgi:exopolyphosphatase/guanosine-5'-triphosphate,3'-diphosphate pyrophosphatase